METLTRATAVHDVDTALLRSWPVPMPAVEGDKEIRGHVLVLGGCCEMPGAIILAATAALRAGAGKLTIATGQSVAQLVALAMPEARVIGLAEQTNAGFSLDAVACLDPLAERVDAVLIGPGMRDEPATAALVHALLPRLDAAGTQVVFDACAMGTLLHPPAGWPAGRPWRFERPVILTPHAGEMAHLTGIAKRDIVGTPDPRALDAARAWNAVVALKGARTVIATPDGTLYQHEGGNVGLAISGSGDVLAGLIAGLAARGAPLAQAACWGVALHARAGERLAGRMGTLGYLAREISQEIPALLEQVAGMGAGGSETIRRTPVDWGAGVQHAQSPASTTVRDPTNWEPGCQSKQIGSCTDRGRVLRRFPDGSTAGFPNPQRTLPGAAVVQGLTWTLRHKIDVNEEFKQ